LKEADYKTDPANAIFFLECQLEMYRAIHNNKDDDFSILEHVVKKSAPDLTDVVFLKTDESFKICDMSGNGIECGQHGDKGTNGSRGGIGIYQRLGTRSNIGHSHTTGIRDGVYQAGHCMDQEKVSYAKGASSWSHSHIVTYPNGKRTIITMVGSKWRA
jgi:hypothetical protein